MTNKEQELAEIEERNRVLREQLKQEEDEVDAREQCIIIFFRVLVRLMTAKERGELRRHMQSIFDDSAGGDESAKAILTTLRKYGGK